MIRFVHPFLADLLGPRGHIRVVPIPEVRDTLNLTAPMQFLCDDKWPKKLGIHPVFPAQGYGVAAILRIGARLIVPFDGDGSHGL